jgi:hypothetical protein
MTPEEKLRRDELSARMAANLERMSTAAAEAKRVGDGAVRAAERFIQALYDIEAAERRAKLGIPPRTSL